MSSIITRLIEFLEPFFRAPIGYLIVAAGVLAETMVFTGWAAPGTVLLLLGSFYAAQGVLSITWVAVIAFCMGVTGDNINYLIGTKPGSFLVKKYGHRFKIKEGVEASRRYFNRYGGRTVLFGRLIAGIDAFVPFTAGLSDMPYGRFVIYDTIGAVFYTALMVSLGYFFGNRWETIDATLNRLGYGVLGFLAILALVIIFIKRRNKKREGAQEPEDNAADECGPTN